MKKFAVFALLALSMAAIGCAKNSSGVPGSSGMAPVHNPVDFPVYPNSIAVGAASFDQAEMVRTIKKNNPNQDTQMTPYKGDEVLLRTPASLSQLESWLGKLRASPPQRLIVETGDSSDAQITNEWGAQGMTLRTPDKGREVFVLVMDPKKVYEKIGPAIDWIDKYQNLPPMLRGGIESQIKKQLGISVSEMLDKSNPVGMTLWGVKELHNSGQRAIVLLDAVKE
jgi:hypothetical protein